VLDVAQAGNQTIKHEILEQGVMEYARAKGPMTELYSVMLSICGENPI